MKNTTWKKLIEEAMAFHAESMSDVVSCTLSQEEMNEEFYDGYGGSEGKPFTLWTKKRVYFPVVYDGAEWCESVSRDPNGAPTDHVGGG